MPEEERLDTGAIYHQLSVADLHQQVPQIAWLRYFNIVLTNVPFNSTERIVNYSMKYFRALGKVVKTVDRKYGVL